MLANELIDRLERLGLLDQEIIEALREQLEQGGTRVTPEAVAKLLVDNNQLTHFQATKLIGELRSGEYEQTAEATSQADDDLADLDLVPEEDESEEAEVVEVEPVVEAQPVAEAAPVYEAEPVVVEVLPDTDSVMPADTPPERPRPARVKREEPKTVWDSFKIYGYLGIIVGLLLMSSGIWWVLSREDADTVIGEANKRYDQQDWQAAQDMYGSFLENFGDQSQYSSLARTRITMTELYKAASFKQEPWQAVELEKEKLPDIANEEGMNEERGNLAALMVDIASNLASSAGRAKETTKKQELLGVLDEQLELMENPMYMSSKMKVTLAPQIQNVTESRARVQRDIDRNIRLDQSEASMSEALDGSDTKAAYDIRKELLVDFPELYDHERLDTLIRRASDLQQTLVSASAKLPKLVTDAPASDSVRSILLTTRVGGVAPDLQGETLYFRAGGSVLALDGENGKLRWRKYVGKAKDLPPVRLDEGVLLSASESLEILRCDELDGSVAWRSLIGEAFSQPIFVDDEVYVATEPGRLVSIDALSGDPKWVTQFPQPLEVGPGVDDRARRAYIPGNHSNLYVVNTRDGSCIESFYIGHDEGTIQVPPVSLLGHLFVMENAGTDYTNVHVLRLNEQGEELTKAQQPFRLAGNVIVPPIIEGRRLIVLTDRGEVTVYDIEPTAERDQVTVAATLPAFYEESTSTQMAVGRSQMWITGTRLGRYELQINTGRIIRDWSIHELDTFIGQPYATDDTLVHARILRGTSAIRISAANPKTGEDIWRTDVGVPVAMLRPAKGGLHAITSQAALFAIDQEAIRSGSTTGPIENPGDKAIAIKFQDPLPIEDNGGVMLNKVGDPSILVYEPSRQTELLRLVTIQIPSGMPKLGGLIAEGGLFLPLESGRAVLVDYRTGAVNSAPFQPASDPVGRVQWTNPIPLPDDPGQVVLADSRKKIYRLRVDAQIRELDSKDLETELLGRVAGVGDILFGTSSGPSADFLIGFELASLNEKFRHLLNGRVIWGPVAAGDVCLIRTDDSILHAFASDGTQKFEASIPEGLPIGEPILDGESIILTGADGWIIALDANSGQILGQTDLGQPLSATPMLTGERLLVPGSEGVIYVTDIPGK